LPANRIGERGRCADGIDPERVATFLLAVAPRNVFRGIDAAASLKRPADGFSRDRTNLLAATEITAGADIGLVSGVCGRHVGCRSPPSPRAPQIRPRIRLRGPPPPREPPPRQAGDRAATRPQRRRPPEPPRPSRR
jgi:hypothetical protein